MTSGEAHQTAERFAENVWIRLIARVAMIVGGAALPFAVWSFSWLVTTVTDLRDSRQEHQFRLERLEADLNKVTGIVDLLASKSTVNDAELKTLSGVLAAQLQAIEQRLKSIEGSLRDRQGRIDGDRRFTYR